MMKGTKILALAIVLVLITSSLLVAFVMMRNDGIAHVTVKTDKASYNAGENVTFKLLVISSGIDFNISDPHDKNSMDGESGNGNVDIIKIPDGIDPDRVVKNMPLSDNIFDRPFRTSYGSLATIHYDHFNSKAAPLNLSWDGMISVGDLKGRHSSFPATSGYYMVIPHFEDISSPRMKFDIDRAGIFYYNGLNASLNVSNYPGNMVSVKFSLEAPPGTTGNMTCNLSSIFQYDSPIIALNSSVSGTDQYYNETIVLAIGQHIERTINYDFKIPDLGIIAGGGHTYLPAEFRAVLTTPVGNYSFGFNGYWNGGWKDVQQY